MYSMVLATLGWGAWWFSLFLRRFLPDLFPGFEVTYWVAFLPALVGLFLAVFTIRARKIWVLLAAVPICSNLSLLALPWVLDSNILNAQEAEPSPPQDSGADPTAS